MIVETVTDDPVLGNRCMSQIFTRWTPTGTVSLPRQIDTEVNGRAQAHMNIFSASSRIRRVPAVRGVRDSLTIGAGDGRVVVYALPTSHAEGMLAAWVPAAAVLFTSDVVSPGAPNAPLPALGSGELARLARARGITPRRYAGGHGRMAEWAEKQRAAQ